VIARIVMGWIATSLVVSPLVGAYIRRHATVQPALVPVSPRRH
jgi:hypothetical protein